MLQSKWTKNILCLLSWLDDDDRVKKTKTDTCQCWLYVVFAVFLLLNRKIYFLFFSINCVVKLKLWLLRKFSLFLKYLPVQKSSQTMKLIQTFPKKAVYGWVTKSKLFSDCEVCCFFFLSISHVRNLQLNLIVDFHSK